jgi:polyhydroxybutyrate depolymerase
MVSSNAKSLPRAQEIRDAAKAAGAEAALVSADVGQHDFPASAYPAVRKWLRGVGLAAALATGDRQLSFQVDGQARTCILHLPPAYDGKRSLPLVIALHGAPGTGKGMADMTGFSDLADREGFIVAYPDGIAGKYGDSWNAAFGEPTPKEQGAQVQEVDDVGFMRARTGELRVSHHTDPARVYVCGHSAGGFMAYGVAIHLADRVAAVGVVNGSIGMNLVDGGTSVPDIPSPVAPIAVIHVCGAEDSTAKPGGGRSDKALVWSARDCTRFFAHADRCAVPGKDATDTAHGVSRTLYSGGMAGTEVQLTVVASCGHQWPTPLEGLSATQELWDFFAAHPKVAAP